MAWIRLFYYRQDFWMRYWVQIGPFIFKAPGWLWKWWPWRVESE